MRYDSVRRWMHAAKCKDSSKWTYIKVFARFLCVVNVDNPDQLIEEYIQDMKGGDPRVRLRTADRMNKFHDEYSVHVSIRLGSSCLVCILQMTNQHESGHP